MCRLLKLCYLYCFATVIELLLFRTLTLHADSIILNSEVTIQEVCIVEVYVLPLMIGYCERT